MSADQTPEALAAELAQLRKEVDELDATEKEKGLVKLAGDFGGTADQPTVPALNKIEELRAKRARLLEDERKTTAAAATASREELAAELEQLREQARSDIEARRVETAEKVEAARAAAENNARKTREKVAANLEEARAVESARFDWRLTGHDEHFAELNGRVSESAASLREQSTAISDMRQENQADFARMESAATKRSFEAIARAQTADEKAQDLAAASKAESRRLHYQFGAAIIVALIAALATIVVALL